MDEADMQLSEESDSDAGSIAREGIEDDMQQGGTISIFVS